MAVSFLIMTKLPNPTPPITVPNIGADNIALALILLSTRLDGARRNRKPLRSRGVAQPARAEFG
jgi:hypothetical protein